jgi:aminobenzoyl-glutamate utilization protein B
MDKAANLLAVTAADLLADISLVDKAKDELKERLGGKPYKCQLPDDLQPPVNLNKDTMDKYPIPKKQ